MTDLKVWVDGKERVIRGVSQETTCESVVLVLAKAAGISGKVALLEKWRDFERILPRTENPLKCLEGWGTHKNDVRLVLQDDNSQEKTIDSINFTIDSKYDLIKGSFDYGSLENFTAIQERKLKTVSRALEILDFQISCWDDSDEKFLYLTEDEIIEDFSVKLGQTVKLQAKELSELHALQKELNELQHFHKNSTSKFELFSEKFSQFESEIADTYDVVEKLLIQIESCENNGRENSMRSDLQNEARVLQLELDEQERLSCKQDKELEAIQSSVSELTKTFQIKTNKIEQLKNELTSEEVFYDLDKHFRPLSPEEEPFLYRQSLSSDSVENEVSTRIDIENITKHFPEVKTSGSNTRYFEDDTDTNSARRSSCGSPEEFFRNWSSSPTRLANSPLNYFSFVNGVKTSQNNPPRLSPKSKIDSQSSERNLENGKNESERNRKMELPFFEGTNDTSMENSVDGVDVTQNTFPGKHFGRNSSTDTDKVLLSRNKNHFFPEGTNSATSLLSHEPPSSSLKTVKDIVRSPRHIPKESSVKATKLHKEKRKHSADNILSILSIEKDETNDHTSTTSSKLQANPKSSKNNLPDLGLSNFAESPTLNIQEKSSSKFNSSSRDEKKIEKLPPATLPKPWRKSSSSSSAGTQGIPQPGARSLLTKPIPDKAYLLPPTVQHKRTHHRVEKPLSRGDLCEEGVFV